MTEVPSLVLRAVPCKDLKVRTANTPTRTHEYKENKK